MAEANISDEELAQLVRRTEDATSAFMRGDMDHYLALTSHARGYTLMNPFGGAPVVWRGTGPLRGPKRELESVGELLQVRRGEAGGGAGACLG
jgi:hypothetical protein